MLIIRDGKKLVPNGKTVLKEGDSLILSGKASDGASDVHLYEITVEENDGFSGRALKDIAYDRKLIIMIRRRGKIIIPKGNTVIKNNDILVINDSEVHS